MAGVPVVRDRAVPAVPDQHSDTGDLSPPVGGEVSDATSGPPDDGGPVAAAGAGWFSPLRIGIAVVLIAAAVIAWQSTRSSAPLYRTASVGTGTVEATLDSVGTITPANQASLNFNVSGTVSAVDVSVGQTVTAGQTLASLNIADLNASVVSAQATLAAAQATLASAEASQTQAEEVSSTSTPASSPSSTTTTTTTPPSAAGSSSAGKVAQLQATLTSDQMRLDADSSQAGSALAQATTLCATPTPAVTPSTPTTTTTTTTTTTDQSAAGGAPTTCAEALTQASAAQAAVAADIKTVTQDESALTSALEASSGSGSGSGGGSASSGSSSSTGKTGTAPSTTASTSSGTAGTDTGGTGTGASTSGGDSKTTKVATPQQLAVDQASIDTAQANLSDAQEALSGVNLVSTISGTVASVSIEDGDSVTAGSSSSPGQIVVIGTGTSYDLSTDINVADIGEVAIGQQVQVTPDATNTVVDGQVSAIGVLASSGTSTTTYPVTISLESSDLGQLSGADANLSIIVKKSVDVTTVPSSAVRTEGSIHLVTVVHANTAKSVRVTLGTVGDVLTQVTSGVSPGQSVALADLSEPLPSTSTTTTRTGFGGGLGGAGGFGGGGGAGGFAGGGGARFAG